MGVPPEFLPSLEPSPLRTGRGPQRKGPAWPCLPLTIQSSGGATDTPEDPCQPGRCVCGGVFHAVTSDRKSRHHLPQQHTHWATEPGPRPHSSSHPQWDGSRQPDMGPRAWEDWRGQVRASPSRERGPQGTPSAPSPVLLPTQLPRATCKGSGQGGHLHSSPDWGVCCSLAPAPPEHTHRALTHRLWAGQGLAQGRMGPLSRADCNHPALRIPFTLFVKCFYSFYPPTTAQMPIVTGAGPGPRPGPQPASATWGTGTRPRGTRGHGVRSRQHTDGATLPVPRKTSHVPPG